MVTVKRRIVLCVGILFAAATYCLATATENVSGADDDENFISLRMYTSFEAFAAAHSSHAAVGKVVGLAIEDTGVSTIPQGWILCDGAEFSAASFPKLAAILSGGGVAATRPGFVRLPDYRGLTAMMDAKLPGVTNYCVNQLHFVGARKGRNAEVRWFVKAE